VPMSDDYQRIELITGTGRSAALDDGTEASDHRGELRAWGIGDQSRCCPRRCPYSIEPVGCTYPAPIPVLIQA
jgi:hypothetical protein